MENRTLTGTDNERAAYFALDANALAWEQRAHAMYVLEGTLITHKGKHGPGTFVWFPEGEVMEHGAGPDGDVTVLLVSNKPFSIQYV